MKILLGVLLAASVADTAEGAPAPLKRTTKRLVSATGGETVTLESGFIYDIGTLGDDQREEVEINLGGRSGAAALRLASGATAAICIPEKKKLTVRGGNASGTTCAGAGICVPQGTTLIVFGGGKLVAYGGNAANGGVGAAGGGGIYCRWGLSLADNLCYAIGGAGGRGGDGGGGAAAAGMRAERRARARGSAFRKGRR